MELVTYTERNLAVALMNDFTAEAEIICKGHYRYLLSYFGVNGLKARQMVIEPEYVHKDYLQDYLGYYAVTHTSYPRYCKRIHFFDRTFTEAEFEEAMLEAGADTLQAHYLGFLVVRPIPGRVIASAVLKPYAGKEGRFWGKRPYVAHLGGQKLHLESLAFQEQDHIVAACATAALWTVFQKASHSFHTPIRSPYELTRMAGKLDKKGNRLIPNEGLSIAQVCQTIMDNGLEPLVVDFEDYPEPERLLYLRRVLEAYAPLGIPMILAVSIEGEGHAIALSGSEPDVVRDYRPAAEIRYRADALRKIYGHDDQFGPYVRMTLREDGCLDTPWELTAGGQVLPFSLILSVYHKIRVSYEVVDTHARWLDHLLSLFIEHTDLIWDVVAEPSVRTQERIRHATGLPHPTRMQFLRQPLPRFVWRVSCSLGADVLMDILFDASGLPQGMNALGLVLHQKRLKTVLKDLWELPEMTDMLSYARFPRPAVFLDFLREAFRAQDQVFLPAPRR